MVYTITSELYPTNMRTQAMGTCSTVARIAAFGSYFIPKFAELWVPLPMLVLGIPNIIASALVLFLPETTNVDLPQNFSEGLELGKQKDKKMEDNHTVNI